MNEQILQREMRKEKRSWIIRHSLRQLARAGALMLALFITAGMIGILQHASSSVAAGNFRSNNGVYMLKVETGAGAGRTRIEATTPAGVKARSRADP